MSKTAELVTLSLVRVIVIIYILTTLLLKMKDLWDFTVKRFHGILLNSTEIYIKNLHKFTSSARVVVHALWTVVTCHKWRFFWKLITFAIENDGRISNDFCSPLNLQNMITSSKLAPSKLYRFRLKYWIVRLCPP